jgi:hypothetical protein
MWIVMVRATSIGSWVLYGPFDTYRDARQYELHHYVGTAMEHHITKLSTPFKRQEEEES